MRWLAFLVLVFGLTGVGHSRVLVVHLLGGDAMFHRSQWVQRAMAQGVSGWLVVRTNESLWNHPRWRPQVWLSDTGSLREPVADGAVPLVPDPNSAYGVRTRLPDKRTLNTLRRAGWAQIDLGEVARALRYCELCTPEQAEKLQAEAWRHVDRWLETLANTLHPERDLLIVVGTPMEGSLWAVSVRGGGMRPGGLVDPGVAVPLLGRAEMLIGLCEGTERSGYAEGNPPTPDRLAQVRAQWLAHEQVQVLGRGILGFWGLTAGYGAWLALKGRRVRSGSAVVHLDVRGRGSGTPPSPSAVPPQMRGSGLPPLWIGQVAIALGVASLFSAGLAMPTLAWSAAIVGIGVVILLGLMRFLHTPLPALGAVSGIGLIALWLDSFAGGVWARWGLLGYSLLNGERFGGLGDGYAVLALCWVLMLVLVWLRIEGNPLGAVYLLGLFVLWLGWRAENFPATLSASLAGGVIASALLIRESRERRRLRIAMQNRPTRTVPLPPARALWKHWVLLVWMIGGALWLGWNHGSPDHLRVGLPPLQAWLSVEGVLAVLSGVSMAMYGRLPLWQGVPKPFRWAWLSAGGVLLLFASQAVLAVALLMFHFCAQLYCLQEQEDSALRRIPLSR